MGQIPAGDNDGFSAKDFRDLTDALAQTVMSGKGKAGQTDTNQTIFRIVLIDKIQRNHGAVVQFFLPFPQCTGMEVV